MWQKKGKGPKFKGIYLENPAGDRVMVLVGFDAKGSLKQIIAESWQMLKSAGWKRGT